jgi:hypothetical protein
MDSLSKLSEVVGSEEIVNLTYMVYQLKHRIVELERQLQISKNTKKVTIKHHRIIYCKLEMDSLSKLSEVVGSEEIVTLDSFLFLITGSPLMT